MPLASVNCHNPAASAILVATFCHVAGGARLVVVRMIFVEFGPPRKKSVTLPSGLGTILVMTAGGGRVGRLNTVPTEPGPPLNVVPYKEFDRSNNPATGNAPSLLVPLGEFIVVKLCRLLNCAPSILTE